MYFTPLGMAIGRVRLAGYLGLLLATLAGPAAGAAEPVTEAVDHIGRMRTPGRVALTDSGDLYVADRGRGVVAIYDVRGIRVGTLAGLELPLGIAVVETSRSGCEVAAAAAPGEAAPVRVRKSHLDQGSIRVARRPAGEVVDLKDCKTVPVTLVFVGDEADGSVRIFEDGTLTGFLGGGAGEFMKPGGIAATDDRVYVVDSLADQVRVYDADGVPVDSFGEHGTGDGELDFPTDIEVDAFAGEVFVSDLNNNRIAVFDLHGMWLEDIRPPPNEGGEDLFLRPAGLGLDPLGNLIVVDNALACVAVLDRNGGLLDVFGYRDGAYWTGELDNPIDAVSDGTYIYVTSSGEGRITVFEVAP